MSFLTPINGGKECLENHLITQQKTGCYKTGVIQEAQKIDFFQLAHFQKLSEKNTPKQYDCNTTKECQADIFNNKKGFSVLQHEPRTAHFHFTFAM